MAVVNTKSTGVSNADSNLFTDARIIRGMLRQGVGIVEAVNGDSIGSTYRYCKVPSNARVSRVLLSCDAITTCAMDVGIYRTAFDGGAVVDADFFGSAVSVASALVHSDVTHEADAADAGVGYGLSDTEKPLWQALQFTTDPKCEFDVVGTLTAAAGSGGTTSVKVEFAV